MHLISPARSMPFGSERSHFAHSPHLLAALILLIPPEIGRELKRKARSRVCAPGFCCARSPGAVPHRASSGLSPASGRRWETCTARSRGIGQFLHFCGVLAAGEEEARPSPSCPCAGSAGQAAGCRRGGEAPAAQRRVGVQAGGGSAPAVPRSPTPGPGAASRAD